MSIQQAQNLHGKARVYRRGRFPIEAASAILSAKLETVMIKPTDEDFKQVERDYPNASDAEKYRLAQAAALIRINPDCKTISDLEAKLRSKVG